MVPHLVRGGLLLESQLLRAVCLFLAENVREIQLVQLGPSHIDPYSRKYGEIIIMRQRVHRSF